MIYQRREQIMSNYEKPSVVVLEGTNEGVYLASGSAEVVQDTPKCKSIYRNGVYKASNWNPVTCDDMGCQGCPAADMANGTTCGVALAVDPSLDYRPSWERAGGKPEDAPTWG
jgi:hypothetical protein